jgi:MAD, mothers against decapentaplegic interacting protein
VDKQKCWLFVTNGLCLNGQEELVFILKCIVNENNDQEVIEKQIPKEILYHIMDMYEKTAKGFKLTQMNHVLYDFNTEKNENPTTTTTTSQLLLLDNKENIGFLYSSPTKFHYKYFLKHIPANYLPPSEQQFLIGYLIQKWEIPWAKLFPLRLYLSIGEQFNTYPSSIISDRYRKSVYGDIGHTIMSLLCDVRNFQYTIAQIDGLKIQLEIAQTKIIIPESQYDLIVKSILTSNDYVFSLACLQMNDTCYSHLVAVENENLGTYTSKTISFKKNDDDDDDDYDYELSVNSKITGAAFVVFNGAMKANLTNNAKVSLVEDGAMISIETETMNKLKQALQSMKPFRIESLKPQVSSSSTNNHQDNINNIISIEWTKESPINKGVYSCIDKMPLTGVKSLRLNNTYDYVNETKGIRWTEIFLIKIEEDLNDSNNNNFNLNRFADMCSQSFCTAITPLLDQLVNLQKIYLLEKQQDDDDDDESKNLVFIDETKQNDLLNNNNNNRSIDLLNPFRIALRIQIDRDQVGYLIGMNGAQLSEDTFLTSLDNELIQLLNHASSSNVSLILEFIFYVQERFNCSNKYVIS